MLGAFAIPLALRGFLLHGAPLTDDESAYRFMAELIASGRLYARSPAHKLFFDRVFMINDGRLYAQYFVGWPALMVPGVWLGATGLMNPLYASLTVPALLSIFRRLAGSLHARAGLLLYLCAPMLMVGAATELSHTSCTMALAWTAWFALRGGDAQAPRGVHAAAATCFGIAVFIRPLSALATALPFLAFWLWRQRRLAERAGRLLAFALPSIALAVLFFTVNKIQNGSFTTSAYQRLAAYMEENEHRFSGWEQFHRSPTARIGRDVAVTPRIPNLGIAFDQPLPMLLGNAGIALLRLNFDLLGWPSSFLLALMAGLGRGAGLFWSSLLCFFAAHLFFFDSGIDSFGPVHYYETALPILVLSALGLRRATDNAANGPREAALLPAALVTALVLVSLAGYVPVRFRALDQITRAIVRPLRPFVPICASWPNDHFVNFRPNSDPDLRSDVLWVNHIDIEADRRLMQDFPGRTGYVLWWDPRCQIRLRPLAELTRGDVPDGYIGGSGRID